jgi:hypothetical protein
MALVMVGSVLPVYAAGTGSADATLMVRPYTGIPPNAAAGFAAVPTTTEGQVRLNWTAPAVFAGTSLDSYQVRIQTYPVSDAGSLAAWWDAGTGGLVQGLYGESPGAGVVRVLGPPGSDHSVSLFPGATYYFGVRSADDVGLNRNFWSSISTAAAVSPLDTAPSTPSGLAATAQANSVSLSWTALSSAQRGLDFDRYRLYRSTQSGGPFTSLTTTTLTTFTDSAVVIGRSYFYRITAFDLGAPGSPGTVLESPQSAEASSTVALPVPTNFAGAALSETSITWSWDLVAGATNYRLHDDPSGTLIAALDDPTASWIETGLSTNTAYSRRMRAANDDSVSAASSVVTRYTHAAAPSGLTVPDQGANTITLSWSGNGNPASTSYDVERSLNGTSFAQVLIVGTTTAIDTGLTPSTTYYYRVRAFNGDSIATTYSATVIARTSATRIRPQQVQTVWGTYNTSDRSLTIEWRGVTRNELGQAETIDHYVVGRSDTLLGPVTQSTIVPGGTTSFRQTVGNNIYYYRVSAVSVGGAVALPSDTIDSSTQANRIVVADEDVASRILVPQSMTLELLAANNRYGEDLLIVPSRRTQDESDTTLRSYDFVVRTASTGRDIPNFSFTQPVATVRLGYGSASASVGSPSFRNGAPATNDSAGALINVEFLSLYWFNGAEYVRVGATVLISDQSLYVQARSLGRYQVRAQRVSSAFALTRGSPYPRIITPNAADNRRVFFFFDNPDGDDVVGTIYDIRGAKIRELRVNDQSPTPSSLVWDGKDDRGTVVRAGVYLYKIKAGKESVTGSVVVAR